MIPAVVLLISFMETEPCPAAYKEPATPAARLRIRLTVSASTDTIPPAALTAAPLTAASTRFSIRLLDRAAPAAPPTAAERPTAIALTAEASSARTWTLPSTLTSDALKPSSTIEASTRLPISLMLMDNWAAPTPAAATPPTKLRISASE